jgi:(p)ppGpp synthase/HD superfamily hydrolase
MELLGGRSKGVRIWATTPDQKGTVAKITAAISSVSGNIMGLGFQERFDARGARWEITFKVQDVAKEQLVAAVKPYLREILDVREV